ncbi:hypothetical protein V8G54_015839 [Vigna mungo]|uniref:Uncharacterized protein n=1 Tax=Vigna mungo TaxID=3915 RepID=A0AAQ3NJ68_VIGMU
MLDKLKEEEEIAEAKKKAEEEQKRQRDALKLLTEHVVNGGNENMITEEVTNEVKSNVTEQDTVADYSHEDHTGDGNVLNVTSDELTIVTTTDTQGNAPTKKLGFGLVGSGKRTTVPSVFHEEEDDDAHKDKKMRPLVPIDYSTEELQACLVQHHQIWLLRPNLQSVYPVQISRKISWMENGIEVGVQMISLTTVIGTEMMKMVLTTEMKTRREFLNVTGIEIMDQRNLRLLITRGFWMLNN